MTVDLQRTERKSGRPAIRMKPKISTILSPHQNEILQRQHETRSQGQRTSSRTAMLKPRRGERRRTSMVADGERSGSDMDVVGVARMREAVRGRVISRAETSDAPRRSAHAGRPSSSTRRNA